MDLKNKQIQQTQEPLFTIQEEQLTLHNIQEDILLNHETIYQEREAAWKTSEENYKEQTQSMQDTAQLGGSSSKAKKKVQKKLNEEVKEQTGKSISKATGYTEEILGQMKAVKENLSETTGDAQATYKQRMEKLLHYSYTPHMFMTSMIRQNLTEYLELVRIYDELNAQSATITSISVEVWEQFNQIRPLMENLRERLEVYTTHNRVTLDGQLMEDKASAKELDANATESWYASVNAWNEKQEDSEAKEYEPNVKLTATELKATWQSPAEKLSKEVQDMTATERVEALPLIYQKYQEEKQNREQAEAQGADAETLVMLRQSEQYYQAYYILAHREAELALASEENADLKKQKEETAREAYKDTRRLEHRRRLEETGRYREPEKHALRTREQATNTYSDKQSRASREELRGLLEKYTANEEVCAAVKAYLDGDRYTVGYTEERKRLMKAMELIEKAKKTDSSQALEDLDNYFKQMTNGTLKLPETIVTTEDAAFINCTEELPKETKSGRGSHRNSLIRFFSRWADKTKEPLFAHEPTVNDLKQRLVSNCYMMAATAGMVEMDPAIIKDCLVDNGNGTVTVRLYENMTDDQYERFLKRFHQKLEKSKKTKEGDSDNLGELGDDIEVMGEDTVAKTRTIYVTVKKETPQIGGMDALSSGALWMQMIEKACAYVGKDGKTGYSSLWYGHGHEFVKRLTNQGEKKYTPSTEEDKNKLFEAICDSWKNKQVFNAGSDPDPKEPNGLNAGHAYTVLGGKVIDNKRYVLLRNPYSTYSTQHYGDGKAMTVERGGTIGTPSSDATYGQFYLEFDKFLTHFQNITSCDLSSLARK